MDAGGRRYGSGCRCFWGIDMLVSNAGIHRGSGSTGRGGRNGHLSSREAMPLTRAAGFR
jgi:hypothetical protein